MDILHEPLVPILRHILATSALPRSGRVLDLASGAGLKLPLLAAACGPDITFLALDRDREALGEGRLTNDERRTTKDERQRTTDRASSITYQASLTSSIKHHLLTADAHALPLVDGCCTAACCIAALGLFAEPVAALRELRRVVEPGGTLLIIGGTQAWAAVTRWPHALAGPLTTAYAAALAAGMAAPAAPDLGDELAVLLDTAGWAAPHTRAFLLDADDAMQSELAMLPWHTLRPLVAARMDAATRAACDDAAECNDIALCTLVLATVAENKETGDKQTSA